jgi:acetyl esterase/lipase
VPGGWVKNNIARHRGRPEGLYVGGHSAGAQLGTLLATDDQFLKGEGASLKDLRDAEARKKTSPASHVREGLPGFFLAYAGKDAPGRESDTKAFAWALREKKVVAEVYEAKGRDHGSLFRKAQDGDATRAAVIAFILKSERPSAGDSSR